MDWDKANFQKISQRKGETKRWETRNKAAAKESKRKGSNRQPAKKKKR
jgi:hypothetical protein